MKLEGMFYSRKYLTIIWWDSLQITLADNIDLGLNNFGCPVQTAFTNKCTSMHDCCTCLLSPCI